MDQVTQFTMVYFYPPIGPVMFLKIFFVKKRKIEHFFNRVTSLESCLEIY